MIVEILHKSILINVQLQCFLTKQSTMK